ncbi:MAG: aminotransferase class I/II-fold pyridoxal phosphate-dependent enzyme [Ideonella sp.]|nr:aminotransferase class I/II-fold pyridoxal phosphate-dependent enzyme [Ideonella sp.]
MSKFGLAGVRIGYLIGRQAVIAEVDKLRPPFNISVLNAEAGLFALEHAEVYAAQAAESSRERARLVAALAGLGRCAALSQRSQYDLGAGARRSGCICWHEGARRADQKRLGLAPLAGQLPSHHRGHPRRKHPAMLAALRAALQDL